MRRYSPIMAATAAMALAAAAGRLMVVEDSAPPASVNEGQTETVTAADVERLRLAALKRARRVERQARGMR